MPSRRNLSNLSPEQLVAEIRSVRAEMEDAARYMSQAAGILHSRVRRPDIREAARQKTGNLEGLAREVAERLQQDAISEVVGTYMLYASTWQRFAGMVMQGARRTASSERVMQRFEMKRGVEAPDPKRSQKPHKIESPTVSEAADDLATLYGIETVGHAE